MIYQINNILMQVALRVIANQIFNHTNDEESSTKHPITDKLPEVSKHGVKFIFVECFFSTKIIQTFYDLMQGFYFDLCNSLR